MQDASGNALSGVTVQTQMNETSVTRTTVTSAQGIWKFDPYAGGPLVGGTGRESRYVFSKAGFPTVTRFHIVDEWQEESNGDKYDIVSTTYMGTGADGDGDGLLDSIERFYGTSSTKRDTDGDGLPDGWEVLGTNWLDLETAGAKPLRKDIFVECDYMAGFEPDANAIQRVVDAFAAAPVSNPDGSTGIALHVSIGSALPHDANLEPVWTEFDAQKRPDSRRGQVYRYCLFADSFDSSGASGVARGIPGKEFLVTLGGFQRTEQEVAGTFMHELGHTLGMVHGSSDDTNWKPNHLSIMNYMFQLGGLRQNGTQGTLDYSRFAIAALDENAIVESLGLDIPGADAPLAVYGARVGGRFGAWVDGLDSNTDWNQNGAISNKSAKIDLNGDGAFTTLTASVDQWNAIKYSAGGLIGDGSAGIEVSEPGEPCLTAREAYANP